MTKLIFAPIPQGSRVTSKCLEVRGPDGRDRLGSIEWHESLGVYGFAASPGRPFLQEAEAMAEIGAFLDELNGG